MSDLAKVILGILAVGSAIAIVDSIVTTKRALTTGSAALRELQELKAIAS